MNQQPTPQPQMNQQQQWVINTPFEQLLAQLASQQDFGALWATLTPAQRQQAIDEAVEDLTAIGTDGYNALEEASAFAKPKPDEELALLTARSPENWDLLREINPGQYDKDMQRFKSLTERQSAKAETIAPLNRPGVYSRGVF